MVEPPNPGRTAGRALSNAPDEIDLGLIFQILRRRWLMVAALTLLTAAAGASYALSRPDVFTSTAIVQKQERSSPLASDVFSAAGQGLPPDAMASEIELLESRAVLGPVVRSLGLNVQGLEDAVGQFIGGLEVDSLFDAGDYVVRPVGNSLALTSAAGAELSVAMSGDTLRGPGFRVPVLDPGELDGPAEFSVLGIPDAVAELRRDLEVFQARSTSLIRIQYTARSPERAAAVVNAVADSYWDRAAAIAREEASRRREFLAGQLASVADSVSQAQAAIAGFQEQSRVLNPVSAGETLAESLRLEEQQIRQLRYQQGLLQSLVFGLSDNVGGEGLERIVTLSDEMVPGAPTVYGRLRSLQDERRRLTTDRYGYREGSSRVAVLDSLIESARSELRGLAEESLDLTGTRLAEAQQAASRIRSQVSELPGQATAINRLEQEAEGILATFDLLSERFYEAQIAEAVASADVEIVDYATPPSRPDPRRTAIPVVFATLLGLFTGTVGAVFLESADKTVRRPGDAEGSTGLPLLAMIPNLGSNGTEGSEAPLVVRQGHHGGPAAEAFKSLPAMIRYARSQETRILAVSSQGPQEGKSFTASNLALALAKSGTRTLLLDCDLHRPKIARMFEVQREPGLSEYLTQQASYAQCTREIVGYPLFVVPAGRRSPDPAQLLNSQRFRDLLAQARQDFDVVVLDTPPVLAVSEVLEVVRAADGVVLVVRAEKTNRFALAEAADRLRRVEAPLLGLILNGVESGPGHGTYGGYYYRYYTYDYKPEDGGGRRTRRRKQET